MPLSIPTLPLPPGKWGTGIIFWSKMTKTEENNDGEEVEKYKQEIDELKEEIKTLKKE